MDERFERDRSGQRFGLGRISRATWQELEELQFKSLAGWYKHFTEKYRQAASDNIRSDAGWKRVDG